jgi:hypothetical protein
LAGLLLLVSPPLLPLLQVALQSLRLVLVTLLLLLLVQAPP